MALRLFQLALLLALLPGCRSARDLLPTFAATPLSPPVDEPADEQNAESRVEKVDYQEAFDLSDSASGETIPSPSDGIVFDALGLSLETLQQRALEANPAVAEAEARVRALEGKCVQVGLPPNPTAGYVAGEIGNEGAAGQQGMFAGQQLITAGKLAKNRAIVCAEIVRAEQILAATHRRVRTDVAVAYYQALVAQRQLALARELVRIGEEATDTSKQLFDAEEIPLSAVLQSEVQEQNAHLQLRVAENRERAAWRQLSAVVGGGELAPQPLAGDVTDTPPLLDWHNELARLQSESPELSAAMADVRRARRVLARECVEAVPNVSTQVSVQYDDATGDTVTGVQVGMPVPLWNRNQGGICRARAEITQANRSVDRLERDLEQRLAVVYRDYADAVAQVKIYAADILPRTERTLELVQRAYREAGEIGYLDLLTAQRTYSEAHVSYLDAVGQMWESWSKISGLLLDGSLVNEIERAL